MMFGAVLRPEGFNAKLQSLDTSAAEKMPGVKVVRDGDFTGVVARDAFTAQQRARGHPGKWNVPTSHRNQGLFEYLKNNPEGQAERPDHVVGSVAEALAGADVKLEAQYTVEYIAHAPLEPRAAVAEWNNGKLTVWTGTQRPFGVRDELMQAFQLPAEKVRVIHPDMGSGYGGKHTGEAAIEAARLAKAAGKPVKVVWTRQEEFTWAYFRPAGLIEIKAGAQHDGTLVAWEHHNYNSGTAAIGTPYDVANQLIQYHPVEIAAAAGFVSRTRRHGQSLRARVAHGRAGARREDGSARIPPEESQQSAAEGRSAGRGRQVRLGQREVHAGARIRHRLRNRQRRLRRHLCRSRHRSGNEEGADSPRGRGVGVGCDRESRRTAQPDAGRDRAGHRRRAV